MILCAIIIYYYFKRAARADPDPLGYRSDM